MTSRRRRRGGAGAVLLGVLALAGCVSPAPLGFAGPDVIAVTGRGQVAVTPDVAVVQVGAEARAPALADATAEVARRMTAVLAQVKALGVQERDVSTVTYLIDPLAPPRRAEDEGTRIVGYRVANVVELRIRTLDTAGRVLDAAVAAGANVLTRLSFGLDDRARAEAQARARAVQDAAATAGQLAEAAGVRLGPLLSLREGGEVRPLEARLGRASLAAAGPGPVEPGELEVLVSVEARYRIER